MFHGHLDYFQNPPLGGKPNTKPVDHGTRKTHNCWFIVFYQVWGPAWIKIHCNSIWLRARSNMTSHYTWGSMTTLHDIGGVLGQPLNTFYWALTISWSWLLGCVWSGLDFPTFYEFRKYLLLVLSSSFPTFMWALCLPCIFPQPHTIHMGYETKVFKW